MNEKLSSLGYLKIGKETTKGTAVVPTVDIPLYSESLFTKINMEKDNPIMGQAFGVYDMFQGQRDHQGEVTVMAEPKTIPHFLQMFLDKIGSTNNGGIYTHQFKLGNTAEAAYTMDFLKGDVVHRFYGCEIEGINPEWQGDSFMKLKMSVSALGSVSIVPILSVSTPTITLSTVYDPQPAKGLVVGDVITLVHVTGATQDSTEDLTIVSIATDLQSITTGAISGTYAAGDYLHIRSRATAPVTGTPFNWARTEFRFGATAAAALTATHTPLEKSSTFDILHTFEDKAGARRSGSFDAVSLVRKQGDAKLTAKKFFNDGIELNDYLRRNKKACVIRMFGDLISGATFNEFRVTFNNMKLVETPDPMVAGEVIYLNQTYQPQYDTTDTQAFEVNIINEISSY